jgi:hypothetical protein
MGHETNIKLFYLNSEEKNLGLLCNFLVAGRGNSSKKQKNKKEFINASKNCILQQFMGVVSAKYFDKKAKIHVPYNMRGKSSEHMWHVRLYST